MDDNINPTSTGSEVQPPAVSPTTPPVEPIGAVPAPEGVGKGAEVPEPQQPSQQARVISDEEFRKFQSVKDKEIAELQKKHQTKIDDLSQRIATFELQAQEQQYTRLLKSIEEAGGSQDLVGLTNTVIQQAKELAQRQTQFTARETEMAGRQATVDAAMKILAADELIRKHGLPIGERQKLLVTESPEQMEIAALNMKLALLQSGQSPVQSVDSGAGSGPSVDVNKMTPGEQIALGLKQLKNK